MNRFIREILRYWRKVHPPKPLVAKLPAWQAADRAEKAARRRRCTQAVHKARERKTAVLHGALARGR